MPCEGLRALEWLRDPRNSLCCTSKQNWARAINRAARTSVRTGCVRKMGGAPRNPAPTVGTTCWCGCLNHQAATAQMHVVETIIVECRPPLGALPLFSEGGTPPPRRVQRSALCSSRGSARAPPAEDMSVVRDRTQEEPLQSSLSQGAIRATPRAEASLFC